MGRVICGDFGNPYRYTVRNQIWKLLNFRYAEINIRKGAEKAGNNHFPFVSVSSKDNLQKHSPIRMKIDIDIMNIN